MKLLQSLCRTAIRRPSLSESSRTYKTGLEGDKGETCEVVPCPVYAKRIAIGYCAKCQYHQGVESQARKKGPAKKKVICNAPMKLPVEEVVI